MILAVDMGNTNIVLGCIDKGKTVFTERLSTDLSKTEFEYSMNIKGAFDLYNIKPADIEGAIISSVVPPLTGYIKSAIRKITSKDAMIVGPGIKTGLNIKTDDPKGVGADLIVASVAALARYGAPVIMIDMGTATTLAAIDKDGNYLGGSIMPGLRSSLEALVSTTSQLPRISLIAPKKPIGRNTVDGMGSGIVLGNAAMIDGMLDRFEEELGYPATVVATGGLANLVIPQCKRDIIIDDDLLLEGLEIIYNKNR